jgi:hypothetical protein
MRNNPTPITLERKIGPFNGFSIRLEINWCGAKKFLALMAEMKHNSG